MMLSVLSMEANIIMEFFLRVLKGETGEDSTLPLPVSMATLIDAEFSAATLMISFGALIGYASPLQMMIIGLIEAFFYAFNKVFLVLGYIGAEDVGGSMTIVRHNEIRVQCHCLRDHSDPTLVSLLLCSVTNESTCLEHISASPLPRRLVVRRTLALRPSPTRYQISWLSSERQFSGCTGLVL
jgi:hypothetical protein